MVIKYITCNSKLIVLQIMRGDKQEIILANGILMTIGSELRTNLFVGINKTSSGYILTNNYVKNYKQTVIISDTSCIVSIKIEKFSCS